MTTTLNDLRDRIRTQIEAASGLPEPLAVSASTIQLAGLRRRVRSRLQDLDAGTWSNEDIDEAIRSALEQVTGVAPHHTIGTIALSTAGREISLSSLTGLLRVEKVWWDYDSNDPSYPPNFRQFEVWPGSILYIDDRQEPSNGDTVRIWYTVSHTIDGLDGETASTIPKDAEGTLVTGACHCAAQMRLAELTETLPAHGDVVDDLRRYAEEQGQSFRDQAQIERRAAVQRARAYDQGDIDEAIRWALHRFNQVKPHRAITTETLSSAGREIDVSAIDYLDIESVWLDYDSSDPDYRPKWADFQVWPGDLLFIDESEEPDSGDTLRIFYTTEQTIDGLGSATVTTLTDQDTNAIVSGAVGFVAQARIQEKETPGGNRDLREWADARLAEFEAALNRIARKQAVKHSGIAPTGDLDRWDGKWA